MTHDLSTRQLRHVAIANRMAELSNAELLALFAANPGTRGWGKNHRLEVAGLPVFVKRVPIAASYGVDPYDTADPYNLPSFYHYGVGSAGFGPARELATHIKTTNWVLAGEEARFPILHHHRFIETPDPPNQPPEGKAESYVQYWNGDPKIAQLMQERRAAQQELVLVLEYVPHTLASWWPENLEAGVAVFEQVIGAVEFLVAKGVVHFDLHLNNIILDDTRPYICDFGLVVDGGFRLSPEERRFYEAHRLYDYGELLSSVLWPLCVRVDGLGEDVKATLRARAGLSGDDAGSFPILSKLLEQGEDLRVMLPFEVPDAYLELVARYMPVLRLIRPFFMALRKRPEKDAVFEGEALAKLLGMKPPPSRT